MESKRKATDEEDKEDKEDGRGKRLSPTLSKPALENLAMEGGQKFILRKNNVFSNIPQKNRRFFCGRDPELNRR